MNEPKITYRLYSERREGFLSTIYFMREKIENETLSEEEIKKWNNRPLIGTVEVATKEKLSSIILNYIGTQDGLIKQLEAAGITFTPA